MMGSRKVLMGWMAAMVLLAATGCATHHHHHTVEPVAVEATVSEPSVSVQVNYFYDDLAPYGRWIEYGPHGWCWTPYDAPGWRPYSDGYWGYTEAGWSWVSHEPWGWATYHYGRWAMDPHYGWVWVPGTVWAPAWVAWHHGNGWAGWAPLPPDAHWDPSVGLKYRGVDRIPPGQWCFVEQRHMSHPKLKVKIVSVARNQTIFKQTRDGTKYGVRGGLPVNEGLEVAAVERNMERKVPRLKVVDADAPPKGRGEKVAQGKVEFYRPSVREQDLRVAPPTEIRKPEVAMSETELYRQAQKDRQQMEESLAKERAALEREHAREQQESRGPQASVSEQELQKQQAAEKQAFEKHAEEQRQVLEQRQEKRIVKQKASATKSTTKTKAASTQPTEETQATEESDGMTTPPSKGKGKSKGK